ncbi:MAG: hypothetical protein JNL60_03540 [Bacteroidia bacterium]|nr:hypothetical protein [Bacteroidia bacterium]
MKTTEYELKGITGGHPPNHNAFINMASKLRKIRNICASDKKKKKCSHP